MNCKSFGNSFLKFMYGTIQSVHLFFNTCFSSVTISQTLKVEGVGEGIEVLSANVKQKHTKRPKTAKSNRYCKPF